MRGYAIGDRISQATYGTGTIRLVDEYHTVIPLAGGVRLGARRAREGRVSALHVRRPLPVAGVAVPVARPPRHLDRRPAGAHQLAIPCIMTESESLALHAARICIDRLHLIPCTCL